MSVGRRAKFSASLTGMLFLLAMLPLMGYAEVPQQINYQGYLTDPDGNSVEGPVTMGFTIYDTVEDGNRKWEESQTVTVSGGIYTVVIGQDPAGNPFPADLFEGERYLEVEVEGEVLAPRQRLTSTPFAMKAGDADTLDGFDSADFAEEGHSHSFSDLSGTATDAQIPDNITINHAATADSANYADNADKLDGQDASVFAQSSHTHSGWDITSGTVADERIAGSIARDGEIMPIVLTNDGPGSGLDADRLDGLNSSDFLNTSNDYGRFGVASSLYEGSTTLQDKYLNSDLPETISATSSAQSLRVENSGSGHGIYSRTNSSTDEIAAVKGEIFGTSGNNFAVNSIQTKTLLGVVVEWPCSQNQLESSSYYSGPNK